MKKRKIICIILVMLLLILSLKTVLKAAESNDVTAEGNVYQTLVKLSATVDAIEKDVPIPIQIYIKNENYKIQALDVLIDLNEDFFYELEKEDFQTDLDMYVFSYNKEDKNLQIVLDESINEGVIGTINLRPKRTAEELEYDQKVELLKISEMYLITEEYKEDYIDELQSSIWILGQQPGEVIEEELTELYLTTDKYKIGSSDINSYKVGDKYISRIDKETTKEKYISNLDTNGEIKITKEDGTELKDGEYVGTGMKIEITRGEESLSLTIVVMGDLDGDGKVTATDLSALNQTILKLVTLRNGYLSAADLDENFKLTATDLSTENKMLLKLL